MSEKNIVQIDVSDYRSTQANFSVDPANTQGVSDQDETIYTWDKWSKWYGYYTKIPELNEAIDTFSDWVIGDGYEAGIEINGSFIPDTDAKTILDGIDGNGKQTFDEIIKSMITTMKVGQDAFCEQIRKGDKNRLINIKPINTGSMKIVYDRKGRVKRYEQMNRTGNKEQIVATFKPDQIFHLSNNKIADSLCGSSDVEAVEETILRHNEALADYKKLLHRNITPLIIHELDTDDPVKIAAYKAKVKEAKINAEDIFVPVQGNGAKREVLSVPSNATLNPMPWLAYNRNLFFQAVGIPQILLGGSEELTESNSKIAYLAFERRVKAMQKYIQKQVLYQLGFNIRYKFEASLQNEVLSDESKDAQQGMEFQAGDITAGRAR